MSQVVRQASNPFRAAPESVLCLQLFYFEIITFASSWKVNIESCCILFTQPLLKSMSHITKQEIKTRKLTMIDTINQNADLIQISEGFPLMPYFGSGSNPGSHLTLSCHFSLIFSYLWQSLRLSCLSWSWVLKSVSQLFCRMSTLWAQLTFSHD